MQSKQNVIYSVYNLKIISCHFSVCSLKRKLHVYEFIFVRNNVYAFISEDLMWTHRTLLFSVCMFCDNRNKKHHIRFLNTNVCCEGVGLTCLFLDKIVHSFRKKTDFFSFFCTVMLCMTIKTNS